MINGIIQARTGSSRLPNKVLKDLGGISVIQRIVKQVRAAEKLDQIILTTSDQPRDDALAKHAKEVGIEVYRGDEDKIMHRLLGAAKTFNTSVVVRLLGDCPLSDPELIDSFVETLLRNTELDMVTNQNPHTFPDGYDISVIRIEALRKACRDIEDTGRPEHLSELWREGSGYHIKNIEAEKNYFQDYRLTLDYPKDLDMIRHVVEYLNCENRVVHLGEVLKYLEDHPDVAQINKEYI
ncbi:MAG: spore coat protein [Micavibrio sp.]|nr:MAG: spore coat protein [Micavibrio sp.]